MATLVTAFLDQLRQSLGLDHNLVVKFADKAGNFAVSLVIAAIILVFTLWMAKWAGGFVRKLIARLPSHGHPDLTLQVFASSLVRYAIISVGLIAVLQKLGVQTTSIIAVLGAASLAVGLALQGTLSNVAAGVMLLILRPYHVGDFVEIAGKQGLVRALDLFTTELTSLEGPRLVVPNGKVLGEMIINFTVRGKRRFEITMGVDYTVDLNKALAIMLECAAKDKRVLADPPPKAHLTTLGDSAVTISLRAWVLPSDYFDTWPAVLKLVKEAFDAQGVTFPYPHQVAVPFDIAHPGRTAPAAKTSGKKPT